MPLIVESQLQYSMETSDFSSVIDDDGFSPGLVRCIIQDKKGFIWFATKDGLNKYDGYHITTYQYDPDNRYSLPDNTIFTLLEDPFTHSGKTFNPSLHFLFSWKKLKFWTAFTARFFVGKSAITVCKRNPEQPEIYCN